MSNQGFSNGSNAPGDGGSIPQNPEPPPVSARVPERVARGVYTTGQLVLDGPKEFVIDFLQGLTRPHQVAARVVVTPQTMAEFISALQHNLEMYTQRFGPPPPFNPPQPQQKPTIQEIYDNFRVPDDVLSGSYANSVLIGHSVTEFFFDFITAFYPTPAVSARVLISAAQVPRFLEMLKRCFEQYQVRYRQFLEQQQKKQPGSPPPPPPTTNLG
ncbi:MAG TPA: DUF3467 domain-containing protein [Tepidisphaeraceae bacterium]|nr:DUF3467 domain-containing protein [Tepidisphaeraceae bacterium]